MDYIFEDDLFEVGAEVDAYCTRCKTDTPHTVLTKYEDEIRSVLCTTCNTSHVYRPPRGDADDDIPEPVTTRRRQTPQKLPWSAAMDQLKDKEIRSYSPRDTYLEGYVVDHPKFGRGYVSEVLSNTKIEATFRDGPRILVHNRSDLPVLPCAKPRSGKEKEREPAARTNGSKTSEPKASTGPKASSAKASSAKASSAKASSVKTPGPKATSPATAAKSRQRPLSSPAELRSKAKAQPGKLGRPVKAKVRVSRDKTSMAKATKPKASAASAGRVKTAKVQVKRPGRPKPAVRSKAASGKTKSASRRKASSAGRR